MWLQFILNESFNCSTFKWNTEAQPQIVNFVFKRARTQISKNKNNLHEKSTINFFFFGIISRSGHMKNPQPKFQTSVPRQKKYRKMTRRTTSITTKGEPHGLAQSSLYTVLFCATSSNSIQRDKEDWRVSNPHLWALGLELRSRWREEKACEQLFNAQNPTYLTTRIHHWHLLHL
jgi:hypothetical protein